MMVPVLVLLLFLLRFVVPEFLALLGLLVGLFLLL